MDLEPYEMHKIGAVPVIEEPSPYKALTENVSCSHLWHVHFPGLVQG